MGILDKVKKTKKSEASSEQKTEKKPEGSVSAVTDKNDSVLIRPMLSEKTTMQESGGQYTFVVSRNATKVDVQKAVEQMYKVKPVRVNMINVEGKEKRFGRRVGRQNDKKKAIVTLPKGSKIDIHEGV